MFKLLGATSSPDLFVAVLENNHVLGHHLIKNIVKKSDVFPSVCAQLLAKHDLTLQDINGFYCTVGPGSFTGSRTALVFFQTAALITKANLYVTSSLSFLAPAFYTGSVALDARSNLQYTAQFKNGQLTGETHLVPTHHKTVRFQLKDFLQNTPFYLKRFQKVKNFLHVPVCYVKQPSVGKVKV